MTQDYRYTAFGLNFSSDIPISELLESDGKVDVYINKVQNIDIEVLQENEWFSLSRDRLIFVVDEVAVYEILNGFQINYQPYQGCDLDNLRLFILGSSIAGILHQRNLIPLHASSFLVDELTVLITGDSGAGKSTTAYEFNRRGASLIADDVSVLNKELMIAPGYPQMKLWQSSLDLFGIDNSRLKRVRKEDDKYRIHPDHFESSPQKLHKIIFLERVEGKTQVEQVKGMELLTLLSQNVFRPCFMMDDEKSRKLFFEFFGAVSSQVNCYLVKRNPEVLHVTDLVDMILEL